MLRTIPFGCARSVLVPRSLAEGAMKRLWDAGRPAIPLPPHPCSDIDQAQNGDAQHPPVLQYAAGGRVGGSAAFVPNQELIHKVPTDDTKLLYRPTIPTPVKYLSIGGWPRHDIREFFSEYKRWLKIPVSRIFVRI